MKFRKGDFVFIFLASLSLIGFFIFIVLNEIKLEENKNKSISPALAIVMPINQVPEEEKEKSLKDFIFNSLPVNKDRKASLLFFGDLMLDRYVSTLINQNGLGYVLENLAINENQFFQGWDLIATNLEGAVTNQGEHYEPEKENDFAFAPEVVGELKQYNFNFFNLANNHFYDQGERGIIETRQNLNKLGLFYSGCADRQVDDCSSKIVEITGRKIGILGFSMVYGILDEDKVVSLITKTEKDADYVVVNIHWGVEYDHDFNKIQQSLARKMVEAGADVIIGHHPHVVQGMEIYKNKPIFYSLGNFIFDQYFSSDTQVGLSVGIEFTGTETLVKLFPVKSEKTQVRLMNDEERRMFLKDFIGWSELSDDYKNILNQYKLEL